MPDDTSDKPPAPPDFQGGGTLLPITIEDEMRRSYLDYSMSVIIGRALPDVRDGLKPVHRRVLYAMHELGNLHNRPYKKSARVVGDVIGKYHPHGDAAVYEAMVRLAQTWSLRYLLVDGQGNFGSVDGDAPAAMRYTEVRMSRLAEELLADIEKDTVDFGPNYNDELQEPLVLPSKFPNLLVNGATGIAVGMATNIPPHNLAEVVDATIHLVENPRATVADLMKHIPGPDFPTGAFLTGREGIERAYQTGRGQLVMRARTEIEVQKKTDRESIIVTEIPYQVNKARLIERIAELVRDKKLDGISDIRDESDRHGMRIVIEVKRDALSSVVLNNLFALTPMQSTFGVVLLSIDGGQPRTLNLKEMLERFISHRREVVTRRTRFELRKAETRLHIVEGLLVAQDLIDQVITIIRKSKDAEEARWGLAHILSAAIAGFKDILGNEATLMGVIKTELKEIRERYGDERRTEILDQVSELTNEDLIAEEDMVVTRSHAGYVKRSALNEYRAQRRGGRGKTGAATKEDDFVTDLFVASTHSYLMPITTRGRLFWLKVHEVPLASRTARGKAIVNLVPPLQDQKLAAVLVAREFVQNNFVFFVTKKGVVKKTDLTAFSNVRQSGLIALSVEDGDSLVAVKITDGSKDILLSTAQGMSIRFSETEVRSMGRAAYGVKGITLEPGDEVVDADVVE